MKKLVFINSLFLSSLIFLSVVLATSVFTDEDEYKFEDTVRINGTEFSPNMINILVEISNPNDETIFQKDVSTDQDGNFSITYSIPAQDQLRVEGDYTVYVISQSDWVYTTFYVSGLDETPPTFSGENNNETKAGEPCNFTMTWNDEKRLIPYGQYIFSTNNSGTWINATPIYFTSTPQTVSNVTILNNTESLVRWKYYASDNASNWAMSNTYEISVVTTVPCELHEVNVTPDCSGGSYEDCEPGDTIEVNATYSGDCPDPAYIQVNANGTDCFICDQDRDTCDDDLCNMTGITVRCSDSPCEEEWEVPFVPQECQNKTINTAYSSLNSDYPCETDSEKKDEVVPIGSFTFYAPTTTTSTTTSTTSTTTVITTTYPTTTIPEWTTTPSERYDTTEGGSLTYWVIAIVIICAIAGVFVWFKFLRTTKVDEFERLKQKWGR